MGFVVTCLFWTGALLVRKWPVAPVSLMAVGAAGLRLPSSSSNPASSAYLLVCNVLVGVTTLVAAV